MRQYRNMKEIDDALRLMELRVHLEREKINLGVAQLKRQTEPQALIKNLLASSIKHISILGLLRGLLKGRKKKRKRVIQRKKR